MAKIEYQSTIPKKERIVIVAASTACIPNTPLLDVFDRLSDLEYTHTEIVVGAEGSVSPTEVLARFDALVHLCRTSRRITPVAIHFALEPTDPKYFDCFRVLCQFAKAVKVVVMTVRASVPGTPFNEEVERLRDLVQIGMNDGVVVGLLTENGRLTESPDTVGSLCKSIPGLAVTLDPSHYIVNVSKPKDYEGMLDRVCHVRLRDSSATQYQVRIGQGILEFGRLVIQLNKAGYQRALCVDVEPLPDVDSAAELRKMRLLLESLL